MSLPKAKVTVKAYESGKEVDIYECTWDGDLGEWMDIGGEAGGAICDHEKVVVTLSKVP